MKCQYFRAVRVAFDVSDNFSIGLGGGVEAEGGFNHCVLEVAVDGLGNADNLCVLSLAHEVFGEQGCIGIRVVAADDDDGVEFHFLRGCHGRSYLGVAFNLGSSRTDDVESAGVAIFVHELVLDLDVFAVDETGRSAEESKETGFRVSFFQTVINTGDNIVSAGSLSAGEDYADAEFLLD